MTDWSLAELLPHAGDMILIDELVSCNAEQSHVRLTVRPGGPFNRPDGSLPAWIGIELMAQAVAAYGGYHAKQAGLPVQLGFLLGTRKYQCNVEHFPCGSVLDIYALLSLEDENGMGVFECHIDSPGIKFEARLNVFRPPEVARFLQESTL